MLLEYTKRDSNITRGFWLRIGWRWHYSFFLSNQNLPSPPPPPAQSHSKNADQRFRSGSVLRARFEDARSVDQPNMK
ncbi:hypothetical protein AAC387_Pa10g1320 [Persea americana]